MEIGQKIKELRTAQGLTQTQLGEKLGITFSMVAQFERGTKKPSIVMAKEISLIFDCTLEELVG